MRKVMKKLKEEVEEKGFNWSVIDNGEEGKGHEDYIVWLLGRRAASKQQ